VVRLWETATGKAIAVPASVAEGVLSADFSPDGATLLSGGLDGKARLWDAVTFAARGAPLDHGARILTSKFSPDGSRIVSSGTDSKVRLWSFPDGQPVGVPFALDEAFPHRVAFSGDGRMLLLAGGARGLALLDTAEGRLVGKSQEVPPFLSLSAVSTDGSTFLTTAHDGGGNNGEVRVWDARTGKPLGAALPAPGGAEGAFHPSGRCLVVGNEEGGAQLWSPRISRCIGPPILHPGVVLKVAIHPTGKFLATGGEDSTVRLWKLPSPVAGTAREVRLLVEVLTGEELDETGGLRLLSAEERETRTKVLAETATDWPS
jgi:WD40 repeat protein